MPTKKLGRPKKAVTTDIPVPMQQTPLPYDMVAMTKQDYDNQMALRVQQAVDTERVRILHAVRTPLISRRRIIDILAGLAN